MARNDIRFAQINQADFSDANQMFAMATQQMNNAIESGKQTIKDFNKVVMDRNDAVIKSFINSIPKEEWQTRQQDIQEFISGIAEKSGNMYNAGAIEEYRDGRMDTLITRDNAQMKNYLAKAEFDDFKDTELAKELVAHSRTPEGAVQVNALLNKVPDTVAYKYDDLKTKDDLDKIKSLTNKNIAQAEYANSTVAGVDGIIKNAVTALADSTIALQNAKSPEEQAKILQSHNANKQALQNLTKQYPDGKNAISKMFGDAVANATKRQTEQSKTAFTQAVEKQKLDLLTAKTKADIENMSYTQALNAEKFAHEVATGGSGNSGSGGSNKKTEFDKEVEKSGYPSKSSLTADSPHIIRSNFQSNVNASMQAKKVELDSVNYGEWLHKEHKNLPKYLTDRESFWYESRLTQLQTAFNTYATAQGGRPLKDYEKIELTKILANEQKGMNDWLTHSDNPIDFINRNLRNIEQKYQNEVALAGRAKASEDMNTLRKAYGLTDNQLLDIILSSGGIGDTAGVIPKNLLDGYISYRNGLKPKSKQTNNAQENTFKPSQSDTEPKTKNADIPVPRKDYLLSR